MPNVLERKRRGMNPHNRPEIKLTVVNGPYTIYKVPHVKRSVPGPDGEMYQLKLSVAYRIAAICEFMEKYNMPEFDYEFHNSYKEIQEKLL